ncbi:MAG: methyltransferase domain-containing protein [Verrucomicrobiota bacterium]
MAIANHGTKNQRFLDRLLAEYRSMKRYEVHIVVLSDIPKDLGPDVQVRVGLPIEDPWSLPFGHKELFASHMDEYDLFIYTEDDTLVTETNIEAFVEETRILPEQFIAGFMRYEIAPDGRKYYSSMHSHYHWDPRSVLRLGKSLFAYHTNEHAACFILTREQLRKGIDSGGFLLPPRKERYDMLVTAATDPYTRCGMTKLVCISRFDDFCLHHLPNVYCGKLGLEADIGKREIERLASIAEHADVGVTRPLFDPFPLRDEDRWNKKYYEGRRDDVLQCVPRDARRVLSVGCGCGTTEAELARRGMEVVGIPLDSIICTTAENSGITVLPPDFDLAEKRLAGQRFDCILILDILQQLPGPATIIKRFFRFLRTDGTMLISVPNWNYHGTIRLRLTPRGRKTLEHRATARNTGVHRTTKGCMARWLRQSGCRQIRYCWVTGARLQKISKWTCGLADEFLCRNLLVVARP